jgi:hypothetical protein
MANPDAKELQDGSAMCLLARVPEETGTEVGIEVLGQIANAIICAIFAPSSRVTQFSSTTARRRPNGTSTDEEIQRRPRSIAR